MAADVLEIPLHLLRETARGLARTGEELAAARSRPAVVYDAGPAQRRVGDAVAGVDDAVRSLAEELGAVADALAATAADLADADRQARVRLYDRTFALAPGPGPP